MAAEVKAADPFGFQAFLVKVSGFGGTQTYTRERWLNVIEAQWEYHRLGGCGPGTFVIAGKLLDSTDTDVSTTAVDDEWEIVLEVRAENESGYSTWYRGIIQTVEEKHVGNQLTTFITTMGYYFVYMSRLHTNVEDTTGTNTIKTILGTVMTTDVTGESRITYNTANVDAAAYVPNTVQFHGQVGRAIRVLAHLQKGYEYAVMPDKNFYFKAASATVADRNVYQLGKDLKSLRAAVSQRRTRNTLVLIGHPRYGNTATKTLINTTQVSSDGEKVYWLYFTEVADGNDLSRIASDLMDSFDTSQEYSVAELAYVRERIESPTPPVGYIRIWRTVDGTPTITDYPLHKIVYRYGLKSFSYIDVVPTSPHESVRWDYSLSAKLYLGYPPLDLPDVLGRFDDDRNAVRLFLDKNKIPAPVAGGGTNIPPARQWTGQIAVDTNDGSVEVHDGATFQGVPRTNDSPTHTGQHTWQVAGTPIVAQNTTDTSSNQVLDLRGGDRTTAANNDEAYISLKLEDSAGNQVEFARLTWIADDVNSVARDGRIRLTAAVNGALQGLVDFTSSGMDLLQSGSNVSVAGSNIKHTITVPAAAMRGLASAGAGDTNGFAERRTLATNSVSILYLAFDSATSETATFQLAAPDNWDGSTITYRVYWTAQSGTGSVVWQLRGRSYADDDALDQAQGTYVSVTDSLIAANDVHVTPDSTGVTLAGIPAGGQLLYFEINRDTGNILDTLNADAELLAVSIEFGVNKVSA